RTHADRAAGTDAVFRAEDIGEQFATAVDDLGMIQKLRCAIDHAQHLDDPLHAVEAPEFAPQRRQDGKAGLARGGFTRFQIEAGSHPASDERFVQPERAMAGDVGEIAAHHHRLVNRQGFRRGWEFEFQFSKSGFRSHRLFKHELTRISVHKHKFVREQQYLRVFLPGRQRPGRLLGGPLKSFFAFHSTAYSPEEAPAGWSLDLITGDHLKSSLFRLALKSTAKSIVSPRFTSNDST